MTRPHIEFPDTNEEWDNLPKEFIEFIDEVDKVREECNKKEVKRNYQSYEYEWEVDSDVPLRVLISHWNDERELPSYKEIVEDILDCLCEEAMIAHVESLYS